MVDGNDGNILFLANQTWISDTCRLVLAGSCFVSADGIFKL